MGVWIEKTSTLGVDPSAPSSPLATRPAGVTVGYTLNQAFGGPEPQTVADARTCCAHHVAYGSTSFGTTWTGACPTLGPPQVDVAFSARSPFSAWILSQWTAGAVTLPSTYNVQLFKGGMSLAVDTTQTAFSDLIVADVGASSLNRIEYVVESVTANLALTPNLANTTGTTDWTGILRSPAAGPDANWHFVTPAEFGAYPQIGSVAPGGGTALVKPLAQYAPQPTLFWHTLYVAPDLGEMDSIDLGLTSSRAGQWQVTATSLLVTFRYRFKGAPPLHQRQRAGGIDGHAILARGRSTRQSSLQARGML